MSIKDMAKKIKAFSWDIKGDVFVVLSLILIGLAGFGFGKLSVLEKSREEVKIISYSTLEKPENSTLAVPLSASASLSAEKAQGLLVASKSGAKYHFPWCSGAMRINEQNKIWFDSYTEARKAGYTAAANCKGLE